jgi:hypothetical protein
LKKLSLKEHIKRSKQAVEANKAKGNRHAEIITQLYNNPARFIDEILQNAEDAYRRKHISDLICPVRFELYEDRIEFMHNGKDFDEDDLKSITTFASSTKSNFTNINLIGKFGIGFKSVFGITEFPEIHSGDYHYRIRDFEVLEKTSRLKKKLGFNTVFVFPFKDREHRELYTIVKDGLKRIDAYSVLFLDQINKIEIVYHDRITPDQIKKTTKRLSDDIIEVTLENTRKGKVNENFLLFSKTGLKTNEKVEIAYKIEKKYGKYIIKKHFNSKLFVYFPTLHNSGLNFLVNADFTTSPTRETVPFNITSAPENLELLNSVSSLFSKSIFRLIDLTISAKSIYEIVPFSFSNDHDNVVLQTISKKAQEIFSKNNLILSECGKYVSLNKCIIPKFQGVTTLLLKKDITELFSKQYWINQRLIDENEDFRTFLASQEVEVVTIEKLAFKLALKPFFLENKNAVWFTRFYEILADYPQVWSVSSKDKHYSLRNTPFILLKNKLLSKPFDQEGQPIVFITDKKVRKVPAINSTCLKSEKVRSFLLDLGLRNLDDNNNSFNQSKLVDRIIIPPIPDLSALNENSFDKKLLDYAVSYLFELIKAGKLDGIERFLEKKKYGMIEVLDKTSESKTYVIGYQKWMDERIFIHPEFFRYMLIETKQNQSFLISIIIVKGIGNKELSIEICDDFYSELNKGKFLINSLKQTDNH